MNRRVLTGAGLALCLSLIACSDGDPVAGDANTNTNTNANGNGNANGNENQNGNANGNENASGNDNQNGNSNENGNSNANDNTNDNHNGNANDNCPGDPTCLVCDFDGVYEEANSEECDDGNSCDYDGCAADSCLAEATVVIDSVVIDPTVGFDLDNADGDENLYTGVDNLMGSNALLAGQFNPLLVEALETGALAQLVTLGDVEDLSDDTDISVSLHGLVDPDCPSGPVYSAIVPPPWLVGDGVDVFSDADQFPGCVPPNLVTDADDSANGIYPVLVDSPTPGPVLFAHGRETNFLVGLADSYIEATVQTDSGELIGLGNGILGGAMPWRELWQLPGAGALCPTALHAVLALVGEVDLDLDGGGLESIEFAGGFLPCVVSEVTITSCRDEDGTPIADGASDGDCVLDPRMGDGYSIGASFSARQVRVREQRSRSSFCPGE